MSNLLTGTNIWLCMNEHKSDFRLNAAGKMDNKLLYDHLICNSIDYFHLCIVDMIHIVNNTESQLENSLAEKNANGFGS